MKRKLGLLLGILLTPLGFTANISVFVSFSMPTKLLEETLADAARLNIPAYLNGLYQNSMPKTALKIMALTKVIPNLNLQIDPTAFERFGINQVPALVVENKGHFDVIYGNLALKEGLARIADHGESGFSRLDLRQISHE